MAWLTLAVAIAHNYAQHRRGRATICSITRRILPRPAFLIAGLSGAAALGIHVWKGYSKDL